jgi:hypothetical protein
MLAAERPQFLTAERTAGTAAALQPFEAGSLSSAHA